MRTEEALRKAEGIGEMEEIIQEAATSTPHTTRNMRDRQEKAGEE